jgi:peptide deformylase
MRALNAWLVVALLSLAACGDDAPGEPAALGGSAGQAGADAAAGGQAGEAGEAGSDAGEPEGGEQDAALESGADAADSAEPVCLSLALTSEEKLLIEEGDGATAMELVTNATDEGNAFLHQLACPVDPAEPSVKLLLERMRTTLAATGSGVGLAAPQVGISRRLFLAERAELAGSPVQAFINPTITAYSPETASAMEGCLSVPIGQPKVTRSKWVTVDYVSEDGTAVTGETIGSLTSAVAAFSARIVQHEYDHLQGILIVDK